jgi:hypothetical protein
MATEYRDYLSRREAVRQSGGAQIIDRNTTRHGKKSAGGSVIKYVSLKRAVNIILHSPDGRLVKTHRSDGVHEFHVTPNGGRVTKQDAATIIGRPDVVPLNDGLFAGFSQSWGRRDVEARGRTA